PRFGADARPTVKISCPSCSAKYSIADEKVQSRLAKIRCRKCGATIVIDGKVSPPHVSATAGDGNDAHAAEHPADTQGAGEYSVDFGQGDQRTLSLADIVSAYNSGQITGETFLWADGFTDWKPLSEIPDVVEALHASTSAPAPAPAASAPSPFAAKPQPSPARAAARPARAAAGDLFGRIETAGSEDDVATSAPEAAAAFGGGAAATGTRNESSVLFSLSALTSAATAPKPSSPSRATATTAASREDSGLIDLKALTAAAVKADGAGAAAAAPAMGI